MNDKEAIDREAEKKEEFIYQGSGDTQSDVIHVLDNFAVNAEEGNSEGDDFYILKCTLCKQCATQNICVNRDILHRRNFLCNAG